VSKTAHLHDFKRTASAMYFIVKQNNLTIDNRSVYIHMFKEVKKMLVESFHWKMIDVHKCFCHLNVLMGYVGKKD
jgi:hypothetical protein